MRSFFKFLLILVFVFLVPVVLLLSIPRLNGFTIVKLEKNLTQRMVYDQASQAIHGHLGASMAAEGTNPEDQIGSVLLNELTPSYLQLKVETLLDQTAVWVVDTKQPAPALSLNDLQQKLLANNPAGKAQIDEALSQLKSAQAENGEQMSQMGGGEQSQQDVAKLLESADSLDSVVSGDWTISLKKPLAGLPQAYSYYLIGLPVLVVLLLLCLLGIFGLGKTLPGRLRSMGWVLVATALWNGVLSAVFYLLLLNDVLLKMVPLSGADGELLKSAVQSIRLAVFDQYVTIQLIASGLLLIIGIALLVTSKLQQPKSAPDQGESHPATVPQAPTTESIVPPPPSEVPAEKVEPEAKPVKDTPAKKSDTEQKN